MDVGLMRGYLPVAQGSTQPPALRVKNHYMGFISVVTLLSFVLGMIIGSMFSTGSYKTAPGAMLQQPGMNVQVALSTLDTTFTYNRSFGADPQIDGSTTEAWDSIVPRKCLRTPF